MIALEMYMDESASSSEGDITLAGFVADVDQWARFATAWKARLDRDNLSHFRATKFRSRNSSLFSGLSRTGREELLSDLLAIICGHCLVGVSCTINQAGYKHMTDADFRGRYGSAYGVAVAACFYQASRFLKDKGVDCEALSVFIEEGHVHGGGAVDLLLYGKKEMLGVRGKHVDDAYVPMGSIGLVSKQAMRPLQAADILAYCVANEADHFAAQVLDRVSTAVPLLSKAIRRDDVQNFMKSVAADEKNRADVRYMMHEMRRFLGAAGVKITNIPGGVQIDASGLRPGIRTLDIELPMEGSPKIRIEAEDDGG